MSFRPFFNPATGEWIEYTAVAEDSNGELVRFKWRSVPGGVITEHIHPHQEERFTITTGEARFTLNGEQHAARAELHARAWRKLGTGEVPFPSGARRGYRRSAGLTRRGVHDIRGGTNADHRRAPRHLEG